MKQAFLYLPLLSLLFTAACQKSICIQGIVLDSKTSKPIPGVRLMLFYEYTESGSLKSYDATVSTDKSGEFSYSPNEKSSNNLRIWDIEKNGYSKVASWEWVAGECDYFTIKMTPLDGLLRLTIINETGAHDSIYAGVFNKCQYQYPRALGMALTKPYPLALQKGEMYSQTFSSCVGDSSAVLWKFSKNDPWFEIDSVLVKTADTAFFEIKY